MGLISLFILCVSAHTVCAGSLGHIYALTSNGTTNLLNVIDVDLTTWETTVGPSLAPTLDTFGQAALCVVFINFSRLLLQLTQLPLFRYDNGTFWAAAFDNYANYVIGFDVITLTPKYVLNASMWESGTSLGVVESIFSNPRTGGLVVTGFLVGATHPLAFYSVENPTAPSPTVQLLGGFPCPNYCSDFAWDSKGEVLYTISNEESETVSGQLFAVSTSNSSSPALLSNVTLQASQGCHINAFLSCTYRNVFFLP